MANMDKIEHSPVLKISEFDRKYHVRNNPAAAKIDQVYPCKMCGWAKHMAIHDERNLGSYDGHWAHPYAPNEKPTDFEPGPGAETEKGN